MVQVKTKLEIIKDDVPKMDSAIKKLTRMDVLVGVPADKSDRQGQGPTNALLAYIHDTGSPAANIPARPFLGPGIMNAKDRILQRLEKMGNSALRGDPSAIEKELNAIGLIAVSSIRAKITSGPFAPLASSTLRARRRAGRSGTKPLIVTGQLRNSISYVLRGE